MIEKIIYFFTKRKFQLYKEALEETEKMVERIKLSGDNTRSIDDTIGYLIRKDIHLSYKAL